MLLKSRTTLTIAISCFNGYCTSSVILECLTSWQSKRIVENQEEVIAYLRAECNKIGVEFIVADFYGDKKDLPFQEQALFVSRANVMIGMHGAGLNLFHFMPFNSVVVEIHSGTNVQKNSENFVNHVKEGKYITTNGKIDPQTRYLMKEPVWETLQQAIDEWHKLGSSHEYDSTNV